MSSVVGAGDLFPSRWIDLKLSGLHSASWMCQTFVVQIILKAIRMSMSFFVLYIITVTNCHRYFRWSCQNVRVEISCLSKDWVEKRSIIPYYIIYINIAILAEHPHSNLINVANFQETPNIAEHRGALQSAEALLGGLMIIIVWNLHPPQPSHREAGHVAPRVARPMTITQSTSINRVNLLQVPMRSIDK